MAKNGLLSPLLRLHPLFPPLPLSALVALSVFAYNAHRRSRSLVHCFARICRQFGESIRAVAVGWSGAEEEDGERVSGIITLRMQGGPYVL